MFVTFSLTFTICIDQGWLDYSNDFPFEIFPFHISGINVGKMILKLDKHINFDPLERLIFCKE